MSPSPQIVAIIPARGGSKRIPRKNIRAFNGKPIIHYPIAAALASGAFAEVMVSTDDSEIASVAQTAGAKIPFLRSAALADDHATTGQAIVEVLETYKKQGKAFTHFVCIYATAAFVTAEDLKAASALMTKPGFDSVIAVSRFGFPIQRALKSESGKLAYFQPEHKLTRSQDLEPAYHDCGQFFGCASELYIRAQHAPTGGTAPYVISETRTQDIDTEEDWQMAELKYRLLHQG